MFRFVTLTILASVSAACSDHCPSPIGKAEDVRQSPREDSNLEALALTLDSNTVTAPQRSYDRIVADVAALRGLSPRFAEVAYRVPADGLWLALTNDTAQVMEDGDYHAWDCLNDFYRARPNSVAQVFSRRSVTLSFDAVVNLDLILPLYRELPGVTNATRNDYVGDGSTLCVHRQGDVYEYMAVIGGGDCPSGCTIREYGLFESIAPGQVRMVAESNGSEQEDALLYEAYSRVCL